MNENNVSDNMNDVENDTFNMAKDLHEISEDQPEKICDFITLGCSSHDKTADNSNKNKHSGKRSFRLAAMALVFSLIGGTVGSFLTASILNFGKDTSVFDPSNSSTQQITINLADDMYYATAVAQKAQKWVVGISSMIPQTTWPFGHQKTNSSGSGVIVDPRGYILTNSHVVGDGVAEEITVSLIDNTTEPAVLLWNDATLDLAVIKIERNGLSAADLGNSDELVIGEPAVAIGNPTTQRLERTVTNGIISGLDRTLKFDQYTIIKPLIQTNASINPGNSGGPLLNSKGQVIGINTAKMSSLEGLGFSIPINTALPILEQLINTGSVSSLYIGIKTISVSSYEDRLGVDINPDAGVVVVEIMPDSPSSKAGLKSGDIIIDINGTKIEEHPDLIRSLYKYKAGDTVLVTYIRNNKKHSSDLTLQTKPNSY